MDIFSIKEIRVLENPDVDIKAEGGRCPLATRDIAENLKNRQNCIDTAGYGPLNPKMANETFWKAKSDRWKVTIGESKKQLCGNCAAFIKTPRIMECIEDGLGNEEGNSAWDVIEAGDLGYCEAFDFKCAASRTCDAWIVGGPITEEKEEKTYPFLDIDQKEMDASEFINSLSNEEFDIMFPDDSDETINEAKWLFDTAGAYLRRSLTGKKRRRGRKDSNAIEEKAAKKPILRDPKGGLTAAGRKYFARTEGSNLKPGVKGPADTPEKMRRKGSFLVRFFSNPRGPMQDEKGRPTRLALSAAAWGEPVPQTRAAALKLGIKGRRLLDKYRRLKNAEKKKDLLSAGEHMVKQLGKPVAGSAGTIGSRPQQQQEPNSGGGSTSTQSNYDPNAVDRDGDGTIQEGTDYARPTQDKDKKKRRSTDVGSADARERNAIRNTLDDSGIDWNAFGRLMRDQIANLKPGDKTNWNPGRLPNGGKIAADGTYIPPDMVREDDKRMSDYYRRRREARERARRTRITREGDVIPNKNRDRRTNTQGTRSGAADRAQNETAEGDIRPDKNRDRRSLPQGRVGRDGSADMQERRAEGQPKRWMTDSGSADTRERGAIREDLTRRGFDGRRFGNLMAEAEENLETGEDTNWNPGRLPGGGKISATGDYIPADMVREDDKRMSDFYRNRRENKPQEPRMTADGTVVPDKNRDRATPNSNARPRTTSDGTVIPDKNRDRATPPQSSSIASGSADVEERRRSKVPTASPKPTTTSSGDVVPNKNRDRATPQNRRRTQMSSDGTVVPNKNRDRATKPKRQISIIAPSDSGGDNTWQLGD